MQESSAKDSFLAASRIADKYIGKDVLVVLVVSRRKDDVGGGGGGGEGVFSRRRVVRQGGHGLKRRKGSPSEGFRRDFGLVVVQVDDL